MALAHIRSDNTLSNRPFTRLNPTNLSVALDKSSTCVKCRINMSGHSATALNSPTKPKNVAMETVPSSGTYFRIAVVYMPYMNAEKMASASPHHVLVLSSDSASFTDTMAAPPKVIITPSSFHHEKRSFKNTIDRMNVKAHDVVERMVEELTDVPERD